MPWVKKIIDQNRLNREGAEIVQYTYKRESVFLVRLGKGYTDALTTVYNCRGEAICEFGGLDSRNTYPDF